jgi:hypothetical protein
MKFCNICAKTLRNDNTIGMCRKHRNSSENRRAYIKEYVKVNVVKRRKALEKYKPKDNLNRKKKYKENLQFKLKVNLRNRVNKLISGKLKKFSAVKDLGCTVEFFINYLESKFLPGMTWENHGKNGWHIDHIKPLSLYNLENEKEFKEACNYKNLQPLWAIDNIKKSNRI